MPGLEQHGEHLPPQRGGLDGLEQLEFAARRLGFVLGVLGFEGPAEQVVQVRVSAGENSVQVPFSMTRFMNRSGIQFAVFMSWRAAAVVAGVLAQFEEFLDVDVPDSRYVQTAPLRLPP